MEPQYQDAGAAAGSEQLAPALLTLLAPAAAVDSLTGSTLPLSPVPAAAAGDAPLAEASTAAAAAAPLRSGSEVNAGAASSEAAPLQQSQAEASASASRPPQAADAAAPVPASPWQVSSSLDEPPTQLTIAGRRYVVADLPPDAREMFEGIRMADRLLSQKAQTCKQLRMGLDALVRELGHQLQSVEPLPELIVPVD